MAQMRIMTDGIAFERFRMPYGIILKGGPGRILEEEEEAKTCSELHIAGAARIIGDSDKAQRKSPYMPRY